MDQEELEEDDWDEQIFSPVEIRAMALDCAVLLISEVSIPNISSKDDVLNLAGDMADFITNDKRPEARDNIVSLQKAPKE